MHEVYHSIIMNVGFSDKLLEYIMLCTPKYRLPEPVRLAHRLASKKD
jgi:deoxyinosine 3'endonuclease (endonuclease V)